MKTAPNTIISDRTHSTLERMWSAGTLAICLMFISAVTGCTSLMSKYDEASKAFPQIQAGQGRIYFYRGDSLLGGGVLAKIHVNDEVVGKSLPKGFFYVDKPSGDYTVSCTTGLVGKHDVSFKLDSGETKYIRTAPIWSFVWTITPTIEDKDTAMKTLAGCAYWREGR